MKRLDISINDTVENTAEIRRIVTDFGNRRGIEVELQVFDWGEAWTEFMKINLYHHGPVVSESGDTWMGSLIARNSLRPFTENEVAATGGAGAFLEDMWQSCLDPESRQTFAIPWSLDTYLVYYRRDLLVRAGVDEASAFARPEDLIRTLEQLQAAGVRIPLAIPTGGNSLNVIHNASSWIWNVGGDFISSDGSRLLLTRPETLTGLRNYFGLYRFLPPMAQNLDDGSFDELFATGAAAVTIQNPLLLYNIKHETWQENLARNIGVAAHPGIPFVGGSNLVVWNHIPPDQEKEAIELIRCLTSSENMEALFRKTGLIPARLEALKKIESDPDYVPLVRSLEKGRAYRHVRLWGLVEDKLTKALNDIWKKIFAAPGADVDRIIVETLTPLEERLNMALSQ